MKKISGISTIQVMLMLVVNNVSANDLVAVVLKDQNIKYIISDLEANYSSEDSPSLTEMFSLNSYNFALDSDGAVWVGYSIDDWSKSSLDGVSDLSVSFNHALAIKDGELYVFGENENGQFGNGTTNDSNMWQSTGITGVDDIAAVGDSFRGRSFILKNGEVYSAGSNLLGRLHSPASESCLGLPCSTSFNKTTLPASNITKLIPGARNVIAQGSDGKTYMSSHTGWFEDPTIGLTDITYSAYDAFAFKGSTLYSYGVNGAGQLDTGDRLEKTSFSATSLSNVKEASMFMSGINDGSSIGGAYALTNDGLLYSIGHNNFGELAIGKKTNMETSWQLTEEKDVVSLMNSGEQVYFKKTDGNYYYIKDEKVGGSYLHKVYFDMGRDDFQPPPPPGDFELPIIPPIENFVGYIDHPTVSPNEFVMMNLSNLDPSLVIPYYDNGGKDGNTLHSENPVDLLIQPPDGYAVSVNINNVNLGENLLIMKSGFSPFVSPINDPVCVMTNSCSLTSDTDNGAIYIHFNGMSSSEEGWEGTITFVPK